MCANTQSSSSRHVAGRQSGLHAAQRAPTWSFAPLLEQSRLASSVTATLVATPKQSCRCCCFLLQSRSLQSPTRIPPTLLPLANEWCRRRCLGRGSLRNAHHAWAHSRSLPYRAAAGHHAHRSSLPYRATARISVAANAPRRAKGTAATGTWTWRPAGERRRGTLRLRQHAWMAWHDASGWGD